MQPAQGHTTGKRLLQDLNSQLSLGPQTWGHRLSAALARPLPQPLSFPNNFPPTGHSLGPLSLLLPPHPTGSPLSLLQSLAWSLCTSPCVSLSPTLLPAPNRATHCHSPSTAQGDIAQSDHQSLLRYHISAQQKAQIFYKALIY
jgi:hypothetical protein